MKKAFHAATQQEANLEADKWLGQQTGLHKVTRTQVSSGWGAEHDKWAVTIHYEAESSN
jgi:hypothetical protein